MTRWEAFKEICGDIVSIRLIWQSPAMFHYAGLYLKVRNKRYRIYKSKEANA
jgi:hypothetical protein